MRKAKLSMVMAWVLILALSAGNTGIAPMAEIPAVAQAGGVLVPAAKAPVGTAAATAAISAEAYAPSPSAEAESVRDTAAEPAIEAADAAAPADTAPEVLVLPDIRTDGPAPSQIKSLPDSGRVCLTFDDGYGEAAIHTILDCLQENNVHCTFFIIGSCLKLYPKLWQRAVAEGHEIAYHTMRHHSLNGMSNEQIVADINRWNETAREVLGADYAIPRIARAPGGSANARVRRLFGCLGYHLIYWSSDTFTGVYRRSKSNVAARIASYILRGTNTGTIVLQHFNRYDASSVSRYVAELKQRFTLGTVSEALTASNTQ